MDKMYNIKFTLKKLKTRIKYIEHIKYMALIVTKGVMS